MANRLPISGPLGLGDLLDRAFRLYRARFAPFLLTAAIFLVPFSLISGLLSGRFITSYFDALGTLATAPDAASSDLLGDLLGDVGNFFGVMLLIGIAGLLVNGMVTLALTSQGIAALHTESLTLGQGIRRGLRRFWAFVGMSIVQALVIGLATLAVLVVIFVLIFVFAFPATALGSLVFAEGESIIATIALVLVVICGYGLALVVILAPAIYFSARWLVATPVLLAEDLGALGALGRSWDLTRGRVLRSVGYVILLYLITAIVVSIPTGLIQQLLLFALPSSAMPVVISVSTAISSLFTVVWTPLYVCAVVLLYYDLRVRAEGYDLSLRVQQLEAEMQEAGAQGSEGAEAQG